MELVTSKSIYPFEDSAIIGIYGDLLDLEMLGVSFDGITYDDEWKVSKFLKYYKNKKRIEGIFKYLCIKEEILNIKIKNLKSDDFKWVLLSYTLLINANVLIFDYFDIGLIYQDKKRLISIINSLKKDGKQIIIISNDVIFLNKCVDKFYVLKDGKIVFDGLVKDAINKNIVLKPPIVKFIESANKKGANLDMELESSELLKNIYRSLS